MSKQYSEAQRRAKRNYFLRNRDNPEYKARRARTRRECYRRKRLTLEGEQEIRDYNNKRYHEINKLNPMWVKKENAKGLKRIHSYREHMQSVRQQLQTLLGGKCIDCGIDECRVLSFDHIDPHQKTFNICSKLYLPWEELVEEAQKCELRCFNCHHLKTLVTKQYRNLRHQNGP